MAVDQNQGCDIFLKATLISIQIFVLFFRFSRLRKEILAT